jgi:hypothetical protein
MADLSLDDRDLMSSVRKQKTYSVPRYDKPLRNTLQILSSAKTLASSDGQHLFHFRKNDCTTRHFITSDSLTLFDYHAALTQATRPMKPASFYAH